MSEQHRTLGASWSRMAFYFLGAFLVTAVLGTTATRRGALEWLTARLAARATARAMSRAPALAHVAPAPSVHAATGTKPRRATIRPGRGAEGARVVLVNGSDDRLLPGLPVTIEFPSGNEYSLIAMRPGYASRQLPVVLDEGKDAADIEISLQKATGSREFSEAARSFGTVDLRSTPWSTVIFDGRAIGSCPRLGVVATAGTHNVLFAGEVGQKRVTFSVRPGEAKTIAVRL